ncbi:alpha-L-arabinofuranosidase C-terminal domain-containing protein [Myceligenerans halotolerans]
MYNYPPGRSRRVWLAGALTLGLLAPTAAVAVAASDDDAGPTPAAAADGDYAGYFFPYFTGESTADGETVSFAVSDGPDPLDWTTLNDDAPVLTSDLGTEGLRDPFVMRKTDGSGFVVLATDLQIFGGGNFGDAQETGSRSIMIWESPDLVNWSEQREVVLAPENAGNLWAPEAFYDADTGEYVVYWASALYPDDVAPEDRDIATSYQRMLYATTTDFVTFSEPQVWIDEKRGDGRGMIDSTIAEEDGVYHRLTKDESYMGMRQESSTDLRLTQGVSDGDGWDLTAERIGFGEPNPWGGEFTGGEGPTMFPSLTDERWFLLQDQPSYHGGEGYMLFETDDLSSGEWTANLDAELPASPRHGSVIPITAEERDGLLAAYPPAAPSVTEHELTIDADAARTAMSDDLYGVFYEDINYAADGGLYAELVRNRSFEFAPTDNANFTGMTAWDVVEGAGGTVEVASERDEWLNDSNRAYLQIEADGPGVGVRNEGYNSGFAIERREKYDFSMFVRSDVRQRLTVRLESADGTTTYAEKTIRVNARDTWREVRTKLRANATVDDARLVVTGDAAGTLRLDMVSLFPHDTWRGPVNGRSVLREDLAQMVADLEPSFLRFPGGCVTNVGTFDTYLESDGEDRRRTYQWKETIGPVEERPTNWNFWGYNQSYGLGYLEYFEFAEDLGATPLPVLSVGANGCGSQIPEMTDDERIDRWVQDTVDLIEFANGDADDTEWGAVRAGLGHPEPFGLEYIGLGNEENTHTFEANFPRFRDAIEERYPDVTVISNSGPDDAGARFDELWQFNLEQGVDMVDEHYYNDPAWFLANDDRYDSYDRGGPHVFLGEYASRGNQWRNALSEAAYMTGIERNADLVELASYAPMFANEDYVQWSPDMMWFDNDESWGSTSYYTQQMFMTNTGDEVVPSEHTGPESTPPPLAGGVFLSTWLTQAAYDDVVVTDNETGEVLFSDDFSGEPTWDAQGGAWDVVDGEYVQSDGGAEDARSIIPDAYGQDWTNYTLELDARKLGGGEGFLVGFAAGAPDRFYWWNLGGWGNSRQALERADGGRQGEVAAVEGHSLVTGQDYDIKVVVNGRTIEMYLDGELQMTYTEPVTQSLYQVVTTDGETGDLLVKVVNPFGNVARTDVSVAGFEVAGEAEVVEMTGDPAAINTKTRPERVVPEESDWSGAANEFTYDFPPYSITFLRLTEG